MDTLYKLIGPEQLREIVDKFYDIVLYDSQISHLFDIKNTQIRDKQYKFLTQFLGGPQIYSMEYGHPKMRMRHLPHKIGAKERDEWLRCMRQAIDNSSIDKELGDQLYNCFPRVASHMVNSEG